MEFNYLKIFSNCIFIKGKNRALVSDLHLNKSTLIPNELFDIVEYLKKGKTINKIKERYGKENFDIIDEYLNHIIENNWGF